MMKTKMHICVHIYVLAVPYRTVVAFNKKPKTWRIWPQKQRYTDVDRCNVHAGPKCLARSLTQSHVNRDHGSLATGYSYRV